MIALEQISDFTIDLKQKTSDGSTSKNSDNCLTEESSIDYALKRQTHE